MIETVVESPLAAKATEVLSQKFRAISRDDACYRGNPERPNAVSAAAFGSGDHPQDLSAERNTERAGSCSRKRGGIEI